MTRQIVRRSRRRGGFTLLEVLLVLVILITLTSSVGYYVLGAQKKALRNAAIVQMGLFKNMLVDYHLDMGGYPSTDQGLAALSAAPDGALKWQGPYAEKIPNDPWGNPYQYTSSGGVYEVYSFGPDGQDSTEDDVRQQ